MKNTVRQTKSLPGSTETGVVNPAFDTVGEKHVAWNIPSQVVWPDDFRQQLKTARKTDGDCEGANGFETAREIKHEDLSCDGKNENAFQSSHNDRSTESEYNSTPTFSENQGKGEEGDLSDNANIHNCSNSPESIHENGHLVLGNSVSSYLECPQGSERDTFNQHLPLDSELSNCSECRPGRSRHSSTSQPGDSGVCSEATSGVLSFFNVLVNNHGDGLDGCRHCGEYIEHCPCQIPNSQGEQRGDVGQHSNSSCSKHGEHPSKRHEVSGGIPKVSDLGSSRNEPVLVDIDKFHHVHLNPHIIPSNSNHIYVPLQNDRGINNVGNSENQMHHHLYTKHANERNNHSVQDKNHPPVKNGTENHGKPGRKALLQNQKAPSEPFLTKYTSCRWKLAYLCFLARFVQTALRQMMGIAVVGMTIENVVDGTNSTNVTSNSSASNVTETEQEFKWSSGLEGVILASFNMGSIITPIIVGYLTTRYGGRKLMTVCLVGGGMFTILLPIAARAHAALIIVFRIITGMALSGTDSLIQAMLARWAPLYEKASLSSCAYTGLSVAGVLTYLVCGYLASIGGEGKGWSYIFYIFGAQCLLLAPLWYYAVYDGPEKHPRITKRELAIITYNKEPERQDDHKQPLNTPWKRILKSPAVWVILMGHITHKWILSFMLSYLPRYFADLFDFGMEMDGLISSLPFLGRIVSGIVAGYLSDWMLLKGISTGRTRKVFQGAGCFGCALCALFIAAIPSLSTGWATSLMVLALSFQNLTSVAFRINLLDIAPRYAGLLNGVISTIATIVSLPAPILTSLLIAGGSRQGWSIVFYLVAAINIIGGVIFVLFAKGEIQDWAKASYGANVQDAVELEPDISVSALSKEFRPRPYQLVNGKVLREVKSFPASTRRRSGKQKEKLSRRATLDVGSFIKRVQSEAFTNLALADL